MVFLLKISWSVCRNIFLTATVKWCYSYNVPGSFCRMKIPGVNIYFYIYDIQIVIRDLV